MFMWNKRFNAPVKSTSVWSGEWWWWNREVVYGVREKLSAEALVYYMSLKKENVWYIRYGDVAFTLHSKKSKVAEQNKTICLLYGEPLVEMQESSIYSGSFFKARQGWPILWASGTPHTVSRKYACGIKGKTAFCMHIHRKKTSKLFLAPKPFAWSLLHLLLTFKSGSSWK